MLTLFNAGLEMLENYPKLCILVSLIGGACAVVRIILSALALVVVLASLGTASHQSRVLVIGDSLLAANRSVGGAVAQVLASKYGATVRDLSTPGAGHLFDLPILAEAGLRISAQVREGPWDTVVMSGGGNDLLFGCGCNDCRNVMDRLITSDGRGGAIPTLVAKLRAGGARVIYVGYLRTPGLTSPVEACGPLGDEMDHRLMHMAERDRGVSFVPLSDLVTREGDRSYHAIDLVHPSVKGSEAIADRVADRMGH